MIKNIKNSTYPMLAHAPGKIEYLPMWNIVQELAFTFPCQSTSPQDLSIVTFNNGASRNGKVAGTFERSIELSGLNCDVLGKDVFNWKNKFRIGMLKKYIENTSKQYFLVADSLDVVLVNKINLIIEKFLQLDCKVLFNAEKIIWPKDTPHKVIDFEKNKHDGWFLNAGLWMGEKECVLDLLEFCSKLNLNSNSDQILYKFAYLEKDYIKVDINSFIFQGLNRVDDKEIEIFKQMI